ncbi:unnamed protein product [Boreogadus saida]
MGGRIELSHLPATHGHLCGQLPYPTKMSERLGVRRQRLELALATRCWSNVGTRNGGTRAWTVAMSQRLHTQDAPCGLQDAPCGLQDAPCGLQDAPCGRRGLQQDAPSKLSPPEKLLNTFLQDPEKFCKGPAEYSEELEIRMDGEMDAENNILIKK